MTAPSLQTLRTGCSITYGSILNLGRLKSARNCALSSTEPSEFTSTKSSTTRRSRVGMSLENCARSYSCTALTRSGGRSVASARVANSVSHLELCLTAVLHSLHPRDHLAPLH